RARRRDHPADAVGGGAGGAAACRLLAALAARRGERRQYPRLARQLVPRPRHRALSGPAMVPGRATSDGAGRGLVSALWQVVASAQLGAGDRRSADGGRRRAARAAAGVPAAPRHRQDRPLSRAGGPDAALDGLTATPLPGRTPAQRIGLPPVTA